MKEKTFFNWLIIVLGLVALTGFCFTPALAEDIDPETGKSIVEPEDDIVFEEFGDDLEITDESFGDNYQVTWIPCYSFTPYSSSTSYNISGNYRYLTSTTNPWMDASINLPSGAYLYLARLYYRDSHAGAVTLWIWREYLPNNYTQLCSISSTGTPGYASSNCYCYHTIANANNVYHARVRMSSATSSLSFYGVRLYWKRQIRTGLSHPFTDIGSLSAEFQNAIAALYHSGITTGTSSTTYSPNNPVTRGQMAAFLARALGLYWSYGSGY